MSTTFFVNYHLSVKVFYQLCRVFLIMFIKICKYCNNTAIDLANSIWYNNDIRILKEINHR